MPTPIPDIDKKSIWVKIKESPGVFITLSVITIASLVFAIISILPKSPKQLGYQEQVTTLIADQKPLNGLSIQYKGNEINNLQSTNITIKNISKEPIRKSDIAENEPTTIDITSGNDNIYDVTLVSATNENSNVILSWHQASGKIIANFDYLNENDAFVIQILHSSVISFNPHVAIIGTKDKIIKQIVTTNKLSTSQFWIMIASSVVVSIPYCVIMLRLRHRKNFGKKFLFIYFGGAFVIAFALFFFELYCFHVVMF